MSSIEDRAFSYRTRKDGRVDISHHGRPATVLRGERAATFVGRMRGLGEVEAQHLMARVTGNFKRGNERRTRRR